jgi:LacI family transcriptional regulator
MRVTRRRRPTITTVAEVANVSIASASRALNGIPTTPDTRARVLAAAEQIGYMPHAAARSLRSRQSGQIAFAMHDVANPVYTTMVRSIQEVASEAGLRLILHSTGADAENELAILHDLGQRFVDGLILSPIVVTDRHVQALQEAAAPVVVIGRLPREVAVDTVEADSRAGAAAAIRHLYALGRRRIALVNGPESTTPGRERRLGYLAGLKSVGLGGERALGETATAFTADAGRLATAQLLARGVPDAILFANDLLAVGGLRALRDAALFVPDQVAVVGMDDTELASLCFPTLSSVDLGSAERARIAAKLLLARLKTPGEPPRRVRIPARFVARESAPEPTA